MPLGAVFRDAYIEVSDGTTSTEVSLFVTEMTPNFGRDLVEDTAVGDDAHTGVPGLLRDSFAFTLKQGYDTGGAESLFSTLVRDGIECSVETRRSRTVAVGATNPRWRCEGGFFTGDYMPHGGRVGELSTSSLTFSASSGNKFVRTIV